MRIEAIAIGNKPPEDVNVLVEVPIGGQPIKYELDKDSGTLVVDRFLYTPMAYRRTGHGRQCRSGRKDHCRTLRPSDQALPGDPQL
jgi:hypothetical protein